MRVLVTGATGFAGGAVVADLCRAGHDVVAAIRDERARLKLAGVGSVVLPDLRRPFDAAHLVEGFDAVVHLAGLAHSSAHISEHVYRAVNADAAETLAAASRKAGVGRFVFVSSIRAQAGASAEHVLDETAPPRPTDAYGRSKLFGETRAADVLAGSDTGFVVLRPVLMFGPGAKGNMATLMRLARTPWPLPLGGFTARRSLLNLDTFAHAVRHVLSEPRARNGTFIVADDEGLTLPDIITALRAGLGRRPGVFAVPLAGAGVLRAAGKADVAARLFGDLVVSTAALKATGWQPPVPVRDGLAGAMRRDVWPAPAEPLPFAA